MRRATASLTLMFPVAGGCRDPGDAPEPLGGEPQAAVVDGPFVGIDRCEPFHGEKVRAFRESAHFNTSALPSEETILGSFEPPGHELVTGGGRAFFQTAHQPAERLETTRRFDLVFGSGKLGQTYAYWSGERLLRPPFSFRPGEPLAEHVEAPPPPDPGEGGVHSANQLPRLVLSRCFQESDTLTCASCHDPHVLERGRARVFSERCLVCHEIEQCGADHGAGSDPAANCIDCHMPLIESASTTIRRGSGVLRPRVRDHRIVARPGER